MKQLFMKQLFISLLGLFFFGCDSSDDNFSKELSEVNIYENNLSKWNALGITSYTFSYECLGIFDTPGKWEIQVYNGEVNDVSYLGEGNPMEYLTLENAPTISTLFEDILACHDGDECSITEAKFDDEFFFPAYIYKSYTKDGSSFTITEFAAQ